MIEEDSTNYRGLPMRELSKGWCHHGPRLYDTLTTNVDVGQVSTNDAARLNYGL